MRFTNDRFQDETVELDGNSYVNCVFLRCKLLYLALERVSFEGCTFSSCEWSFDGPAENMLVFLRGQYHGQGPRGYTITELIFRGIQDGTLPESSLQAPALAR